MLMRLTLIALAVVVPARSVAGHGALPTDVPVDRLVTNLTRYIEAHPDDPSGYYRLGRVHTLALETKSGFVRALEWGDQIEPAEGRWAHPLTKKPEIATAAQIRTHLTEAIRHLEKAIGLRPTEARYRLTLACALEAGLPLIDEVDNWPCVPTDTRVGPRDAYQKYLRQRVAALGRGDESVDELLQEMRGSQPARDAIVQETYALRDRADLAAIVQAIRHADWREQIETQFFTAMCYALPDDGRASEKPIWGDLTNWAAFEAAADFVRVVEARAKQPTDFVRLNVAKATIRAFGDLPTPRAITPIVLDLNGRRLAEVASSRTTAFDLDGTGRPQRWTWIVPDAGLLVWDPDATGRITSGRQLFGSVSWWLFFDDGYQALDLLDDDGDGELSGGELKGLAVWFDRNSNGVSDTGEVTAIERLGVAAISCRGTGRDGAAFVNPTGLRMTDGRVLPTFDWIASSDPGGPPR